MGWVAVWVAAVLVAVERVEEAVGMAAVLMVPAAVVKGPARREEVHWAVVARVPAAEAAVTRAALPAKVGTSAGKRAGVVAALTVAGLAVQRAGAVAASTVTVAALVEVTAGEITVGRSVALVAVVREAAAVAVVARVVAVPVVAVTVAALVAVVREAAAVAVVARVVAVPVVAVMVVALVAVVREAAAVAVVARVVAVTVGVRMVCRERRWIRSVGARRLNIQCC